MGCPRAEGELEREKKRSSIFYLSFTLTMFFLLAKERQSRGASPTRRQRCHATTAPFVDQQIEFIFNQAHKQTCRCFAQ
jgi:hypothetical protein